MAIRLRKPGSIFATLERRSATVGFRDAMIAGIALENWLTVVTRSKADYSKVPGLPIDEW